jgi:hypothetical protein
MPDGVKIAADVVLPKDLHFVHGEHRRADICQ